MKCINCNTDNNLKDRTANQGRCKNCNHPFAFEPTAMTDVKITDGFFQKAIADISVNNTLSFNPKQLLYLLDKKFKRKTNVPVFGLLFIYFLIIIFGSIFFGAILGSIFSYIDIFPFIFLINYSLMIVSFFKTTKASNQSYAARQSAATTLIIIGAIILIIGTGTSLIIFKSFLIFALSTILGMLSIYLGITAKKNKNTSEKLLVSPSQLEEWLTRWQQINGQVNNILPPAPITTNSTQIDPEITNYSFDRLVVTDTQAIAQFLIANNFHFENNCAILSITGYPRDIFDTVLTMLRRNPQLQVYAFHNATSRGVSLVHTLKTNSQWFADSSATIYELGILPHQVLKNPKMTVINSSELAQEAKRLSPEIKQGLSLEEIEWLELGNYVELESFAPQKLLQLVTRGITLSRSPEGDMLVPIDTYQGDQGYIYAVDSFG